MKLGKYGLFTTFAASLFFASQASAALVIDDFNNPAGPGINSAEDLTDDNNVFDRVDGAGSVFSGAGILGGERDLYVELLVQGTSAANGVEINVDSGSLSYATGDGDVASASIQYDGADSDAANVDIDGLGAVDFAAAGNAFILDVISADASFNFAINLWSNAGAVFEQVILSSGPTQITSPVLWPFHSPISHLLILRLSVRLNSSSTQMAHLGRYLSTSPLMHSPYQSLQVLHF